MVGIVGMKLFGLLTLVMVFLEATSEMLGLGMAWELTPLGWLGAGIPTELCGLRPLVLVLVLVRAQLDVSNLFHLVVGIKVRLSDSLPDRLLAVLEIRHKFR